MSNRRMTNPAAFLLRVALGLMVLCSIGCMVGPNYSRPSMTMSAAYHELPANPADPPMIPAPARSGGGDGSTTRN